MLCSGACTLTLRSSGVGFALPRPRPTSPESEGMDAMGLLVDGKWRDGWYSAAGDRRRIRAHEAVAVPQLGDGRRRAGPSGEGGFKAEPGRYHLYVSLACPWAHRTLIFRALKAAGGHRLGFGRPPFHGRRTAGRFLAEDGDRRRHALRRSTSSTRSTRGPTRPIRAGAPCRCCGVARAGRRSSPTNAPEIIRMLNSAFDEWGDASPSISIPEGGCAARSTPSTRFGLSVSEQRRLPGRLRDDGKPPMRKLSASCSRALGHAGGSPRRTSAIWSASTSPRRTGGCSPRSCASIRSMSATSSAVCRRTSRLSESVQLPAGPLPGAVRRRGR